MIQIHTDINILYKVIAVCWRTDELQDYKALVGNRWEKYVYMHTSIQPSMHFLSSLSRDAL